ncbi:MAG TPA: hypothetical protein DEA39_00370, partial [Lachnospiraceae bacterium]|nr:hypothetical protein [Lachnospiraceae bacterium]
MAMAFTGIRLFHH